MDEKKEKKTFKEKVIETKDKAKTFIVEHICRDHGIGYSCITNFGTDEGVDSPDNYLGSQAFKDGTCFHDTM